MRFYWVYLVVAVMCLYMAGNDAIEHGASWLAFLNLVYGVVALVAFVLIREAVLDHEEQGLPR